MANQTTSDARTHSQKIRMGRFFDEERAEYEDTDGYTIVYEDDKCAIVADHTGHELNEWAKLLDADREDLRSTFRALADQMMGERDAHEAFSHSDPVVFDKLEN
jgi:hypothetical protein